MLMYEELSHKVLAACIEGHRELGPGLLESAYQACHVYELRKRGRIVLTELKLPIIYDGQEFDEGYRIDEFVDNLVIVENKAIDSIQPIHLAQLITYLKLKNCKLGFLINWNVKLIKNGIQRVANGIEEPSLPVKIIKRN